MNKDTSNFFINVSNGWFWFVNFTSNRIWRFQMTIFINTSYWVITFRNNFICLTISCLDDIWFFTFFSCVIWCVIWWFRCILTRFLNFVTFRIYISDNYFTFFWCFFHFIDIGNIFIFFSNWTCNRVWSCKVTIWVNLTNSICTCWYQLISFTVVLNCSWTIIFYCIIVFIDRLLIFICYWIFNSCSFSIFIVNVNVTFFICLLVVMYCITRWFFICCWNWVLVTKSTSSLHWITWSISDNLTCCWIESIFRSSADNVLLVTTRCWVLSSFWFSNKHVICFAYMSSRIPTCDVDKTFIWLIWVVPWWNCQLVITILTINNSLISLHVCRRWNILLTWFNHWSSVNKCVAVSICVVPHCSFIVSWNRRWIQNIDFSYCWTVIGNDFTNTFYVVVLTCTLKFGKFSTYSVT